MNWLHPTTEMMPNHKPVPLNDLKRQYLQNQILLNQAVQRVMQSAWYILGPEVEAFEYEFAAYCGATYCVGLANGTDALEIGLRALGIAPGDEVITVANAGMYSTTAIRSIGASPVFVEIEPDSLLMDPHCLEAAITPRSQAVILTHLYGTMANVPEILKIVKQHGLPLIEDCAQAHGAVWEGKKAGIWGDIGCFSFYPTKNLGAVGDGGAIVTSDGNLAAKVRLLRQYGWTRKYESSLAGGRNSRLDEMQAAVLRAKLPLLDQWNAARRAVAQAYEVNLHGTNLRLPVIRGDASVAHLYVVRHPERDRLLHTLKEQGIGCDVHYPIPDHLQHSCADLGFRTGYLPRTEEAAQQVLSLPCFAELTLPEVEQVTDVLQQELATLGRGH